MLNKIKIPIKGLHCSSCEILTEDRLSRITGVKKVNVSQLAGEAVIEYEGEEPDSEQINSSIRFLGYEVGEDDKTWFSRDYKVYYYFLVSLAIVLGLYCLANIFGLTALAWNKSNGSFSWALVLIVGLTAGFSSCMAIVGGMILAIGANHAKAHPNLSFSKKLIPSLIFMAGRIGAYFILGGVLGILGQRFKISATVNGLITLLVGVVLLFLGLKLIKLFPRFSSWQLTLPKVIAKNLGLNKTREVYSHWGSAVLGGLTFFTPCGFTQAMQLYALSSGSFWAGATIMGLFALGTAPGILSLGTLASAIKGKISSFLFVLVGVGLMFFSVFNISNGYKLLSLSNDWLGFIKTKNNLVGLEAVEIKDGYQIIRMTQSSGGYAPNKFKLIKGIKTKWIIISTAPNSCSATLIAPKLNIEKQLVVGENIIEFTPDKIGKIGFSCSMGMYSGSLEVVDNSSDTKAVEYEKNNTSNVADNTVCDIAGGCDDKTKSGIESQAAVVKTSVEGIKSQTATPIKIFKTSYTLQNDIQPSTFKVKVGDKVRLEVYAQDEGRGCMSSILIQGLSPTPQHLSQGQTIVMEFTAEQSGNYLIACAMNVPRGKIVVE